MILITGASGLLGSSLVSLARDKGRDVVGLCHRHALNLPGTRTVKVDLTDESKVERVFDELQPESVIHCAAQTNVDWCQEHPESARCINAGASGAIARIAARTQTRLLYISTDSVFDGARGNYSEDDAPAPLNAYAESKLEGEREVLAQYPLAAIARVNIYGWNAQNKPSLAEWILGQLVSGQVVRGFTDVLFCPILANDLAEILLAIVDRKLNGIYHVVGAEVVSKYDFAISVAATFDLDCNKIVPAKIAESKLKAPRPRNMSLSTEKICRALVRLMPDVNTGLQRFRRLRAEGYPERLKGCLTEVGE